ncbi:MAG: hypothetical protein CMM99_03535 [Rickettsiales bacterium]|nr:hypothetical protein [Rickettsiales bacterium]
MKGIKLIIFAILMSFCTSAFVSAFIIILTIGFDNFLIPWLERFIIAWPVVFICIIFFAPRINKLVSKYFKDNQSSF